MKERRKVEEVDWLKERYVVEFDMVVRVVDIFVAQASQSNRQAIQVV